MNSCNAPMPKAGSICCSRDISNKTLSENPAQYSYRHTNVRLEIDWKLNS